MKPIDAQPLLTAGAELNVRRSRNVEVGGKEKEVL